MSDVRPFLRPNPAWNCRIGRVSLRSTSNIVRLPVATQLDLDPSMVLAAALGENMTSVVIIGYDSDGAEYFASSVADGGTVLWLVERAKQQLIDCSRSIDLTGPATA